jgi:hypothetical protein
MSGGETKCKTLFTEGMNSGYNPARVIEVVGKVPSDLYPNLITTCKALFTEGMTGSDHADVIHAVGKLNPVLYGTMQGFIRLNPNFLRYVPTCNFSVAMHASLTEATLKKILQIVHQDHCWRAPYGTPQALVFE